MKKSELCEAYGVSLNFLQQFIDAGILKDVQYDSGKDSLRCKHLVPVFAYIP